MKAICGASQPGGEPHAVWTTPSAETNIILSPDGKSVALVRGGASGRRGGGDLFIRSLADGKETHLTHSDAGLGGIAWSPDGSKLSYSAGAQTIRHDEAPDYSGAKIIYTITERKPGELFVISAAGGQPVALKTEIGFEGAHWMDAKHVVFERQSADFKKQTIFIADVATGESHPVHEDVEQQFWSIPGNSGSAAQPSPDGRWIAFLSDLDGWDHLYVMPVGGGEPVQITKGKFEAWHPVWSHDSTRIAFDANEADHPGDRHLGIADIKGGLSKVRITYVTTGRGTNTLPMWSADDSRLVYEHTDSQNSADLFVIQAATGASPRRISDSMPSDIDKSALVEPEYVHFPGADGTPVPGWLFVPKISTAPRSMPPSSGFTATESIRTTMDGTCSGTTRSITASINICCSKATWCSHRIIAAVLGTAAPGETPFPWTLAAKTPKTRGCPPII